MLKESIADAPLHIAVITNVFPKLSETFVLQHVTGLLDRGHTVVVFAENDANDGVDKAICQRYRLADRTYYHDHPLGIATRLRLALGAMASNLRRRRFRMLLRNLIWLPRRAVFPHDAKPMDALLRAGPQPLLHCHFGPNGVRGAHLKRVGLVDKLFVSFHGYDISRELRERDTQQRYQTLFEEADLLLPVSEYWGRKLRALGAPPDKIQVHHMGVQLDSFEYPRSRRPGDDTLLRLVTTARLTEKKGLHYAVQALAQMKSEYPAVDFHYDVIGDGPLADDLQRQIAELGLSAHVVLRGSLPHGSVRKLLATAHIFLLPSVTAADGDQEGIPVALMEAMALGMPVVATLHSGIPELVEDGVSGYLVPERDSAALCAALVRLARQRPAWKALGQAGRQRVEQDFNLDAQNDRLVLLYRQSLQPLSPMPPGVPSRPPWSSTTDR